MADIVISRKDPIELQLNSGHHFYFFPLDGERVSATDSAGKEGEGLRTKALLGEPWRFSKECPWCAYRLTLSPDSSTLEPGLLVAIETNDALWDKEVRNRKSDFNIPLSHPQSTSESYGVLLLSIKIIECSESEAFDLFVDFGNTRSIALIASQNQVNEHEPGSPLPFFPVNFVPKCWPRDRWRRLSSEDTIVDSWLVLVQPQFSSPSNERSDSPLPAQAFVEDSPAVLGGSASDAGARKEFLKASVRNEGEYLFLTTPKGSIWDKSMVSWFMLGKNEEVPFHGFEDLDLSRKQNCVVFFALSVLEAADRQIQSFWGIENVNRGMQKVKHLKNVIVTYPGSWTSQEREIYEIAWDSACKIFRESRPRYSKELEVNLLRDEAVSAQITYAYAESEALGGSGWVSLYGREADSKIRVLNVDVGGGTTDISIITYEDTANGIKASTQFSHSLDTAGDSLVRCLIQNYVVPQFLAELTKITGAVDLTGLREFLDSPDIARERLLALNHGFVPIVQKWFELSKGRPDDFAAYLVTLQKGSPELDCIEKLGKEVLEKHVLWWKEKQAPKALKTNDEDFVSFEIKKTDFRKEIRQNFEKIAFFTGELVSKWDCDVVFLSGKVCELLEVKKVLRKHLPLLTSRIIFADTMPFGSWYPRSLANGGFVRDSKSLSVVGAALEHYRLFPLSDSTQESIYQWYVGAGNSLPNEIVFPDNSAKSDPVMIQQLSTVWRKLVGADDRLRERLYRAELPSTGGAIQKCKFEKDPENQSELKTSFAIVKAETDKNEKSAEEKGKSDAIAEKSAEGKLKLQRSSSGIFWRDNPKFFEPLA